MNTEELIKHFDQKILNFNPDVFHTDDNGLLGGRLGLIYYFFNSHKINGQEIYLEKIALLLESVFENCSNKDATISTTLNFSDGLCGLGFVLNELLNAGIIDEEYAGQLEVINDLALDYTIKSIRANNFDFFYGAMGGLFYLSETDQWEACERVINELIKIAPTHRYLYNSSHEDEFNQGINFGLAHGNTAIFMILIGLIKKGMKNKSLKTLVNKGVKSLLTYEREEPLGTDGIKNYFPHNVLFENGAEKINFSVVLGWCNSELDIALLIQEYLQIERNNGLETTALKIGLETLKRKAENTTGVYDHHFCHGSSGVAQLYKKMYVKTQVRVFDEAYSFWAGETANFLEKEKNEPVTREKLNFLYGWPGALLSLKEQQDERIQGWDKLFLI